MRFLMGLRRDRHHHQSCGAFLRCCKMLLVLGSLIAEAGALTERSMSAGARRRSLDKARASSPGGAVVAVDDVKFDRFVAGVPRQYEAIVFFTASDASYKCASCRLHLDEFTILAESYKATREATPEALKGVDIFFFVADFGRNQQSFQRLNLQQVPKVIHFPPALAEGEEGRYIIADPSQHMQLAGKTTAEEMSRFVKERTGASIPITRPERPVAIILFVVLALGVLAIKPIISNMGLLLSTIRNRYLWLSLSLMAYTFGISGGVYDIIRNPAAFHFQPGGKIVWFHPQSNVQFVVEGFITGIMTLFAGMSGVLLVQVAPKMRTQRAKTFAVAVTGCSFLFFFYQVMKLYSFKNKWYHPIFH